jgi:predicted membrane protein
MFKTTFKELKNHIPFTGLATAGAVLIVLFIHYILKQSISEEAFHIFHYLHLVVSAMVTAAIFYKYKPKFLRAFVIGILGAVIIGSLSDVILPYFVSLSLNLDIRFHLPLFEETFFTLGSAIIGSLLGIFTGMTKSPHFIHVFLSVFASLFYLMVFSPIFSIAYFIVAFFVVFIAVIVPCCLSDIIFPLLFVKDQNHQNRHLH